MKYPLIIASVLVTAFCWGVYGPVLHWGQQAMDGSRLRSFLCVGMAYFVIAVVAPIVLLNVAPEKGQFSATGVLYSSLAGVAGAIGALGIIYAFNFGGKPVYVMPLVFGCAPVVNSFWTIYHQNTWKDINSFFSAGLILVAVGAVTVLVFAPTAHKPAGGDDSSHVESSEKSETSKSEPRGVPSNKESAQGDAESADSAS